MHSAEGAIDALATNPADSSRALVIDYKTGGTPDETPEQLREKHALQARVYADVLHKAGFEAVTVKFVRAEQVDPANPCEPPSGHLQPLALNNLRWNPYRFHRSLFWDGAFLATTYRSPNNAICRTQYVFFSALARVT